ncbi:MAG: glycosyltransferase family 4 protein [bacterium]|nr:glycosyltransferase family 4 protein [bacterium]
MQILLLNWRDPKNPKSGGAEYIVGELLKHRIKLGDSVTWFAMTYTGAKAEETLDGIKVIRAGGPLTVQGSAKRWYRQHSTEIDLIIDQTHGLPFFAPRWAKCPVLFYANEVAGPIAKFMLPWPFGYLYQWLEPSFIRQYRDVPAVSISSSTTADLRQFGYRALIVTLPLACDTKPLAKLPALATKEKELTLIFAARLVPLKRPDHALQTLQQVVKEVPEAKLWILGSGVKMYEQYLQRLAERLGILKQVKFWGFVSTDQKKELMQRAHLVLITSIKEGWGLTVPEANALGTVGVTYNIAGVRDSNLHNQTGLLSKSNNPAALAESVVELWQNPTKYARLRQQAWEVSQTRTWDKTEAALDRAINNVVNSTNEKDT